MKKSEPTQQMVVKADTSGASTSKKEKRTPGFIYKKNNGKKQKNRISPVY
jgi:hypothetical protein